MPELPDVEVFKRYLEATSLHKKIDNLDLRDKEMLKGVSSAVLKKRLKGKKMVSAHRHGKILFAEMENDGWLVLHFGMTGFLKYFKNRGKEPPHTRLLIHFQDGYRLAYDCQRKLGEIGFTEERDDYIKKKDLGPDVFDETFDKDLFKEILDNTSSTIKSALMDQKKMAGIGNVYSDEILFQAGIHPGCKINELDNGRIKSLYAEISSTLQKAIKAKAQPERFPASFLTPHRRSDRKCPKCSGDIEKEKIAGRTAYYCPDCQACG